MADEAQKRHESIDIQPVRIVLATAAFLLMLVVSLAAAAALITWLGGSTEPDQTGTPQRVWRQGSSLPHVEPNQAYTMQLLREQHQRQLQSCEWIDRDQELVRIPIDRAMQVLAEEEMHIEFPSKTTKSEDPQ